MSDVHPLDRIRVRRGETVSQFAAAIGVQRAQISRWRSGEQTPDILTQVQMADRLGVPPDWVLDYPWPAWLWRYAGKARKPSAPVETPEPAP